MEPHVLRVCILALLGNLLAISMEPAAGNAPPHNLPNETCIVMVGQQTCADTGDSMCKNMEAAGGGVCPNPSVCIFCSSGQGLFAKRCVGFAGGQCPWDGGAQEQCIGTKRAGNCAVVNGVCKCVNPGPPDPCQSWVPGC